MANPVDQGDTFDLYGGIVPTSPVILSVPHAGRDYPAAIGDMLRVPVEALSVLEDRHVDAVAHAARAGLRMLAPTMLVQRTPRAWIDLNRAEDERDPMIDDGAAPLPLAQRSAKVRSGLGLVPRRIAGAGDLWRRRLSAGEVMDRVVRHHRPYHHALEQALAAAWRRFGIAVLLDIHSMPPLGPLETAPRVVLGDRFGRATSTRFMACAASVVRGAGQALALNAPYAGGHVLERHARPRLGIHAIQLELDRSLYLDPALNHPGHGLDTTARLVGDIISALQDEALDVGLRDAAE